MQYTGLFNIVKPKSYIKINYTLIFYSAINYNKLFTVIPLLGDPKSKRGEVTGQHILSCLQSYLPDLIKKGETF
ncbi:unnamed protein product [Fusarium fujikuroi]|nr:unnamed protein product [Fusarium fujikuroi]